MPCIAQTGIECGIYVASTTPPRLDKRSIVQSSVSGVCALCGANFAFSPGKHGQRFCSPNCRKKAWLHDHLSTNSLTEIKRALRSLERRVKELENR